jgi:predicted SAM-dependent methyltransferase
MSQEREETLREVHRLLSANGRLLVFMPNLRAVGSRYYDYVDHNLSFTDRSLVDVLQL